MMENYLAGSTGKSNSYPSPGAAVAADRNPDAISSRIDQANNNLGSIEARLRDLLISVRGPVPSTMDGNGVEKMDNILAIRTGQLLNAIERVSDMVNELRSLL